MADYGKTKISLLILLLISCTPGKRSERMAITEPPVKIVSLLTNDSIKFWDNVNGFSFLINKQDHKIIEYVYNEIGLKFAAPYGYDIVTPELRWKLKQDTIDFLLPTGKIYKQGVIEKISDDSLILSNIYPFNKKIVRYFRAKVQQGPIIDGEVLPSDTSKWIVKPQKK
jgi:hypothetical protein